MTCTSGSEGARAQQCAGATRSVWLGDFKNAGRTWQPKGQPIRVQVHDFPSMSIGKAVPYGIYDVAQNRGFVNVGTSHDTPDFAVESIRVWWEQEGRTRYPLADSLLVLADSGGSNSARSRLWKVRLQELADALQHHHHRVPSAAWHQQVEQDRASTVRLHQHPLAGSAARRFRDDRQPHRRDQHHHRPDRHRPTRPRRPTRPASRSQTRLMAQLALQPHATHPQWNYSIAPRAA